MRACQLTLVVAAALAGCGGASPAVCNPVAAMSSQLVIDQLTLPQDRSDDAVDLNGDGKLDNQFGNLIGALAAYNLSPQDAVDAELASGDLVLLLQESAADFADDRCAAVETHVGRPTTTAGQPLVVDPAIAAGSLSGSIDGGVFASNDPAHDQLHLLVPLVDGAPPLRLDLSAARLQLANPPSGGPVSGQINGAIRYSDLQSTFLPSLVAALQSSAPLRMMLDLGDGEGHPCTNPDGTMSAPGDGQIGLCELSSSVAGNLVLPDVALFDDAGDYHPDKANRNHDSLSVGVRFGASPATF